MLCRLNYESVLSIIQITKYQNWTIFYRLGCMFVWMINNVVCRLVFQKIRLYVVVLILIIFLYAVFLIWQPCSPCTRPNVEARRVPLPINITQFLRLSPMNVNKLTINWTPEVGRTFVACVNVVEKLTSSYLLDKLKEKSPISVETTKQISTEFSPKVRLLAVARRFESKSKIDVGSSNLHLESFSFCPRSFTSLAATFMQLNLSHYAFYEPLTMPYVLLLQRLTSNLHSL